MRPRPLVPRARDNQSVESCQVPGTSAMMTQGSSLHRHPVSPPGRRQSPAETQRLSARGRPPYEAGQWAMPCRGTPPPQRVPAGRGKTVAAAAMTRTPQPSSGVTAGNVIFVPRAGSRSRKHLPATQLTTALRQHKLFVLGSPGQHEPMFRCDRHGANIEVYRELLICKLESLLTPYQSFLSYTNRRCDGHH